MRRPNQQKRRLSRSGSRSVRLKVDPAAHVRSSAAGGLSSSTSFGFPTGCSCCWCTQGRCVCVLSTPGVCVCRPCARADACVLDLLSSPRPENVLIAAPSKPPSSPPSKSHDNRLIIILHHRNTPITSGGGRNKNVKKKKRNAEPEAALTNFWNGTGRFFVISVLRCSGFADARKG